MTTEDKVTAAKTASAKAARAAKEAAKANAEATAAVAKDTAKKTKTAAKEVAKKGSETAKDVAKKGSEAAKGAAKKGSEAAKSAAKKAAKKAEEAKKGTRDATRKYNRRPKHNTVIQYRGREIREDELIDRAIAQFVATEGAVNVTKITIYIKPEDAAAYYVINGQYTGRVDF